MKSLSLVMIFAASLLAGAPATFAAPKTVSSVELNRYLGRWYEIASIPQYFSEGCLCTQAQYSKRSDGKIRVLNTCRKGNVRGEITSAEGVARVDDTKTNSKLSVSFFGPFWGDYWIIGLASDYSYSVVSNSDASSLWILSRTPTMSPDLYKKTLEIARRNGVNINKVQKMTQKGCP